MEHKPGTFRTSIGGQALIEGILMRGPEKQAIVVRSPEGLVTKVEELTLIKDKSPILGLPILRGAVTFLDSMIRGVKALMFSADYFPDDEAAQTSKLDLWLEKHVPAEKLQNVLVWVSVLLSLGNVDFSHGDTTLGIVSATVSVVAYGGYIVGVRRSRAVEIDSTVLTCCVMAFGALFFIAGGLLTGGVRLETDPHTWLYILGVAIPATAVSNMALVQAIKSIGPTLTSIFGAMEPLTAVVIGVWVFAEPFTAKGAAGILLIVAAVSVVVLRSRKG